MENNLNKKILEEKGFSKIKKSRFDPDSCDEVWHKRYRKNKETMYFLGVKHYSLKHPTTHEDISGYEIDGQFYLKSGTAVNMTFLSDNIDEVEEFINNLFDNNLLISYEKEMG